LMGKGLPGKETLKIRHRLQRHASGEGTHLEKAR